MRIHREKVLLSVDEEGQPDYDFMEQYVREREKQLIAQYIEHIGTVTYTEGGITPLHEMDRSPANRQIKKPLSQNSGEVHGLAPDFKGSEAVF